MTDFDETVSDDLDLTEVYDASVVFSDSVSSALSLTETIVASVEFSEALASSMSMTESADPWVWTESLTSDLSLTDEVHWFWAEDRSDSLALTDSVAVVWPEAGSDSFDVMETVSDTHSMGISSSFDISETMLDNAIYSDALSDSLALTDAAVAWVVRQGDSQGCDASYNATAALASQPDVRFSGPGASDLVVRAPEFGNSITVETGAVVRKLRGGDYKVVKPDSWPMIKVLKMTFSALTLAKRDEAVTFFSVTSGKLITYRDQENVTWSGVVLSQTVDFDKDKPDCGYEIELEFRGVRT